MAANNVVILNFELRQAFCTSTIIEDHIAVRKICVCTIGAWMDVHKTAENEARGILSADLNVAVLVVKGA